MDKDINKTEIVDDTTLGLTEDEKQRPKRPMFHFREIGLVIPLWGVLTLEKDVRYVAHPVTHPVYGIVINRGMEPSQSCPVGEKAIWYERYEMREQRFDEIVDTMDSTNFKVINV